MPRQCISHHSNVQASLARPKTRRYAFNVAANSATGLGNPNIVRRISATVSKAGAFFMPATSFYGGCAWDTFGCAGCLTSRFSNLRTAATRSLGNESGSSSTLRATPDETRSQSVQNSRRCPQGNGSRSTTRKLQPSHSPLSLQLSHGKSTRSGKCWGRAMKTTHIEAKTAGGVAFGQCNAAGGRIFRINPGIPVGDALECASNLLGMVNMLSLAGGMDGGNETFQWAAHELSEMAKAIIDDVTTGLLIAGNTP